MWSQDRFYWIRITVRHYSETCLERPLPRKTTGYFWQKVLQWSLHFKTTSQPDKYGPKFEMVLKWRDIYIENIRMATLIASLKMEGIVKWRGS